MGYLDVKSLVFTWMDMKIRPKSQKYHFFKTFDPVHSILKTLRWLERLESSTTKDQAIKYAFCRF